ncbi:MAG: hypothetical protein J07HQX50_02115 [Haloquadratum sp. J07HQX50]|nr:MAG: hypothetical protein J07HQX50_02115 [Haloquadratum sp. J07HQX50]
MFDLTRTRLWQKSTLDDLYEVSTPHLPRNVSASTSAPFRSRVAVGVGLRQRVGQAVTVLFLEVRLLLFRQHEHGVASILDASDAPPEVIPRAESSMSSSLTS